MHFVVVWVHILIEFHILGFMLDKVQITNKITIEQSLELGKEKCIKDVIDIELFLEDNIMSFESNGNEPKHIQCITKSFHIRFHFVK